MDQYFPNHVSYLNNLANTAYISYYQIKSSGTRKNLFNLNFTKLMWPWNLLILMKCLLIMQKEFFERV